MPWVEDKNVFKTLERGRDCAMPTTLAVAIYSLMFRTLPLWSPVHVAVRYKF